MAIGLLGSACTQQEGASSPPAPVVESDAAPAKVTLPVEVAVEPPRMTLQSHASLEGFRLHFINHDHDWKITADPIRLRISDSETQAVSREALRGVRVERIERDERGFVTRLQVVFETDDGEIRGWSYPLGVFALQLHVSTGRTLSAEELDRLFVRETGFHVNYEVREVDGRQLIRIPLAQIETLELPNGARGDDLGALL